MAEEGEEDSFDFRKLLELPSRKAKTQEPAVSTGDISTPSTSSKEDSSGSKPTGAAPAVRAGLGRWASILQQVPESAGAAVEAPPAASSPSDGKKDTVLGAEEDDETDWRKLLDSGWSKSLRKTSSGLSVASAPVKSSPSAPGSGLGSCMSLLSKPSDEAISAELSPAAEAPPSSATAAKPSPAVEATTEVDAHAEEDDVDLRSFLDFAWGKATTAKDTSTQDVEPVEADFVTDALGVEDPMDADEEKPGDMAEPEAEDALANMADQDEALPDDGEEIAGASGDEALQDNGEEVAGASEDLLEDEGLLDNTSDAAIEEVEGIEEVEAVEIEAETAGDEVDDAGNSTELSTEVEEVVTFKGKDVGAVTVHAKASLPQPRPRPPATAPPKALQHVLQPRAKGLPKAFLRGVTPVGKAGVRPSSTLKGAAAAAAVAHVSRFVQRGHLPKPAGFLRPVPSTHQFGMVHGQLKPGHLRPTMGKSPMGTAHMGKAPMGKLPLGKGAMGKAFHGHGKAHMGKAMNHQAPRGPGRPGPVGKFAPIKSPVKPMQPAQPPLAKQLSGNIRPGHPGPQVGLKRPGTDHSQAGSALKRQRSDDGPIAAVDTEGRRFDLKHVVVNMANVGATYGKKVLKRGEGGNKVPGQGMLDWEGLRKCIKYLSQNLGLKVVGVIHENYQATDNNRGGRVDMPQDIRRMCESVEETPRLTGDNHKSADDEMTIKCAYHRNCRFLDNDNYRDWKQQLRDDKCRVWLEKYQDLLHMRYYFDSGVGNFETIDGNVPPSMLAQELSKTQPVNKVALWTAPRR